MSLNPINFILRRTTLSVVFLWLMWSCANSKEKNTNPEKDNFDREAMLLNWADNIIIPAYKNYVSELNTLKATAADFTASPNEVKLVTLRTAWLNAYIAWQSVSMFEIGKAESLTVRNFTNIYPTDAAEIESNITGGSYNLMLPSKNDEQGFPALDYLINGLSGNDAAIVNRYSDTSYSEYMTDVITRMDGIAKEVLEDWESEYKTTFVSNNSSSATSSVDKVINDYLFFYEKYLRAGKIGIPAGVFSPSPLPENTEAFYHKDASKVLFMASLDAVQNFFNGRYYGSSTTGFGLKGYLDHLETKKEGQNLSTLINAQFEAARNMADGLDDDFATQIEIDNFKMLSTYDELQKALVMLKVDMLQALNVQVDFVDADGD